MKKHYIHKATVKTPCIDILRWLRQNGVRDQDWSLEQANYNQMTISFKNEKLELAYILKYSKM